MMGDKEYTLTFNKSIYSSPALLSVLLPAKLGNAITKAAAKHRADVGARATVLINANAMDLYPGKWFSTEHLDNSRGKVVNFVLISFLKGVDGDDTMQFFTRAVTNNEYADFLKGVLPGLMDELNRGQDSV